MECKGKLPLIDGDILRYEVGFAAEAGYRHLTGKQDGIPPFHFVEEILLSRIENICGVLETDAKPRIFITEGRTFRYDMYPEYKAGRVDNKPWHFDNLTLYMKDVLHVETVHHIEADDKLAIEQTLAPDETVIVTRDKDLRQVPGWHYGWEIGRQPSFGPKLVTNPGEIERRNGDLKGWGYRFFCGQLLTGDGVDNIKGLPGAGPAAAYNLLADHDDPMLAVREEYDKAGYDDDYLLLQGRLLWMTRRLHEDGNPVLWEIGMEE